MRFLLYSFILLLTSCASEYSSMKLIPVDTNCVKKLRPTGINTSWYDAGVEVQGRHISGLLLIKQMPDSVVRIVFTNEAGITYFDMSFDAQGKFKTHYIMKQLNKKAVLNTLRADFELLMGIPFRNSAISAWQKGSEVFFGVRQKKKMAYFITDPDCASLQRLEVGSKRKKMVTGFLMGESVSSPDSLRIQHHNFNMTISLQKLSRE